MASYFFSIPGWAENQRENRQSDSRASRASCGIRRRRRLRYKREYEWVCLRSATSAPARSIRLRSLHCTVRMFSAKSSEHRRRRFLLAFGNGVSVHADNRHGSNAGRDSQLLSSHDKRTRARGINDKGLIAARSGSDRGNSNLRRNSSGFQLVNVPGSKARGVRRFFSSTFPSTSATRTDRRAADR